ncbi:MAG: universal stress protein [Micromonosporaceae bacterium]|nr:universal stress protein [Micromonosporaceae bacterium]
MDTRELIVGVDGSPEAERALAWAATEAARRRSELLVVHTYDWYELETQTPMGAPFADEVRRRADALVAEAVATARRIAPGVAVRGQAMLGQAAHTLVTASADGATIVVGNRGRGGVRSLLLGSVSQKVAVHAHGPVVIVRGRPDADLGDIVVGVDGSPQSQHALQAAFEEAVIHDVGLVAVRAYSLLATTYAPYMVGYVEDPHERWEAEMAALRDDVATVAEKYPEVPVSHIAVEGHPGVVLTQRSAEARLVVVGSRGHGGFSGLLLGSVGLHLIHHAQCPVLIARPVTR